MLPPLTEFLNSKPLYYDKIDFTFMPQVYQDLQKKISFFPSKVIHIIGTNGKGSTGRYLAHYLHTQGFGVGHYSSPHIFSFNERIWLNGGNATDDLLQSTHYKLLQYLSEEAIKKLTYFEYTTLLCLLVYHEAKCDFIVLEAGLGGEYDATNVVNKKLTLVTPIDYDHKEFLGESIEEIATTKLNAISKKAILATQYNQEIYSIAHALAEAKHLSIHKCEDLLTQDDYHFSHKMRDNNDLPLFQITNLYLAICAIRSLGINQIDYNVLQDVQMPYRCQQIAPNIYADVGHNELGAKAILYHLRAKKVNLIYNSFSNKKYAQILTILSPIVDTLLFIDIDDNRMCNLSQIRQVCLDLHIKVEHLATLDKNKDYLVFGSFLVVEHFVNRFLNE